MTLKGKIAAFATAAVLGSAGMASAALLDFTDNSVGLVGSIGGVGYTVTGVPADPSQAVDTDVSNCAICGPLAVENDGLGIGDDEVTTGNAGQEYITITFDEAVKLTGVYWLDLFRDPNSGDREVGNISRGSVPGAPSDHSTLAVFNVTKGFGFREDLSVDLNGTSFTFFVGSTNDAAGRADAALAGITIAAVPLPAGLLLLGTALGGFGIMRRRKNA